ncbi:MAG: WD domain protein [Ramalina farinacea]|uniref:Mitochondrial division protein 1 n=1 Tax=Ramalina farinacea TaxID=258253 RepID=A0AA43TZ40_9LECA|nr:WD domain protein [Ramalina farinacea]
MPLEYRPPAERIAKGKAYPHALLGHHHYIYTLAFSPKGNVLVSGSYDEAVILWDVRTRQKLKTLPAHSDPVGGVDFVRDGTLIVSCAGDGLIRIWDTSTGQCLRTLVHEDNAPVTAVRFSPNGKFVLAWTLDACVRLWNYVEGRCVKTYQGHSNCKYSLSGAFGTYGGEDDLTPGKAFVVSGSEDGRLLCWDVVSKEIVADLEGHAGPVLGVDTREDGLMISGGVDRTVRIWAKEPDIGNAATEDEAAAGGVHKDHVGLIRADNHRNQSQEDNVSMQ